MPVYKQRPNLFQTLLFIVLNNFRKLNLLCILPELIDRQIGNVVGNLIVEPGHYCLNKAFISFANSKYEMCYFFPFLD